MAYTGAAFLTGSTAGRPHISNIEMLGGMVSGSTGEYLGLPVSSSELAGVAAHDAVSATAAVFTKAVLSSSFVGSSGSIVQALNYLKGNIDAQLGAQDLDFSGDGGTGAVDLDSQTFNLTMNGGETAASGQEITFTLANATNGGINVAADAINVNLNDLAAGAIAAGDSIAIIDADDSNASKKESIADVATLFAGTTTSTGLAASSAVLSLSINGMTASTTIADADLVAIDDGANGTLRKMTRANLLGSAKAVLTNGVSIASEFTATAALSSSAAAHIGGAITTNGNVSTSGSVQAGVAVSAGTFLQAGTYVQAGAAGAHSYVSGTELRLHGTNAAGAHKSFALSVSGGMLQVNALG
jgi:hypothetical protein